jgi:hypothetical protein
MRQNMLDQDISNQLIGLLVMCPCYKYLENCPLSDVHSESLKNKISWVMSLENEKANKLIMQCEECQKRRRKKKIDLPALSEGTKNKKF